jgi:hypothetical protein
MVPRHQCTEVDVQPGQVVRVCVAGEVVGSATRHGRGWSVWLGRQRYEAVTLDQVLSVLGALPRHAR